MANGKILKNMLTSVYNKTNTFSLLEDFNLLIFLNTAAAKTPITNISSSHITTLIFKKCEVLIYFFYFLKRHKQAHEMS